MSERAAERRIEVDASPRACFAALTEYESMPEWQRAVTHCVVVSRDEEGRGRDVDWRIDAKLRSISYRLRYDYDEPHRIVCSYIEGDMDDLHAEYSLEPDGDATVVTLALRVKPGVPVPGPLARILNGRLMRGALEDLKKRVEGT
jgi:uncharacterized protein YndB with AHSA1/START domain